MERCTSTADGNERSDLRDPLLEVISRGPFYRNSSSSLQIFRTNRNYKRCQNMNTIKHILNNPVQSAG